MRKVFLPAAGLLIMATPATSQADILAGWNSWTTGAGNYGPQVTSNDATGDASPASGSWIAGSEAASNDGTYGSTGGAAPTGGNGIHIGASNTAGSYVFVLTADPGTNLVLDGFHFDARRKRSGSPENWVAEIISGSVTPGVLGSGSLGNTLGGVGPSDHDDFSFDLTGLADNVVEAGTDVTVRISFSGGTQSNTDQKTYLDNVAYTGTGTPVPEPTSLALIGLGGLLVARRRRRG